MLNIRQIIELLTGTQQSVDRPENPATRKARPPVENASPVSAYGSGRRTLASSRRPTSLARVRDGDPDLRIDAWVPPGESIEVQGRKLSCGMLYVGSRLTGIADYIDVEPALINPGLPVDNRHSDVEGEYMSYWPSYSDIQPACRAAYLDWLAAGRTGGAYIGYVFLFFYGIERRILFETAKEDFDHGECDSLVLEVERLLELYGDNGSFNGYASRFLSLVRCLRNNLDVSSWEPPQDRQSWELPFELKLVLGSIVDSGQPLPATWALTWLRLHPETSFRIPAVRCADEFNPLFKRRYCGMYGAGMKIRRNKTTLKHTYHPASGSFCELVNIEISELPDVSRLEKPTRLLRELAEGITNDLDAYSRWVGRYNDRDSLAALALLPAELVRESENGELHSLLEKIDLSLDRQESATVTVSDLVSGFPSKDENVFSTREATLFVELLGKLGIGIEPDIRISKVNLKKHQYASIFRLHNQFAQPRDGYHAASVLLHLGAAVAAADAVVTTDESEYLERHLEEALALDPQERTRLKAHLQWLLIEPPTLNRMKPRVEALSRSDRERIARYTISVAGADGGVSAKEIKVLSRVYKLIGLDDEQLHREIHELASSPSALPVTVMRSDESKGHQIRPYPEPIEETSSRVELDPTRLQAIMEDTRAVSDLLTEIFEGPSEVEPTEIVFDSGELDDDPISDGTMEQNILDPNHAEILRFLARRATWPRIEFEQIVAKTGLMPAGAIEKINDAAFECCDEPLIEGDDPLEMNEFALKELLNVVGY